MTFFIHLTPYQWDILCSKIIEALDQDVDGVMPHRNALAQLSYDARNLAQGLYSRLDADLATVKLLTPYLEGLE